MPSAAAASWLAKPISEYIEASNAFDLQRLVAAFADDALVNDARREFRGRKAIRRWAEREIIGDKVTFEVRSVEEHYDMVIVNGLMDGEFDKSNLPDELILTHYFTVHDGQIGQLIIIRNNPAP
jgi:ketosteroid isomerase-like protein